MAPGNYHARSRGFTLIEMMVALLIMAIIGVMAWRGLDSLVRGKDRIESHNTQQRDMHYALTVLDRDCRMMVHQNDLEMPPVALGNRTVWWIRQVSTSNQPGWQIVGYRVQADGLIRLISPGFNTRDKALETWRTILTAPDSGYSQTEVQPLSASIIGQSVTLLSDAPNKTLPVKGLKFVWELTSNQAGSERLITRVCLGGGF